MPIDTLTIEFPLELLDQQFQGGDLGLGIRLHSRQLCLRGSGQLLRSQGFGLCLGQRCT